MITFASLPPPPQHRRSIFLHTLVTLIGKHSDHIDETACVKRLYGVKYRDSDSGSVDDAIQSTTIKYMIAGLSSLRFWRTLNREQMRAVVQTFPFLPEEKTLLYASLIAMSPQKILVDFMLAPEVAWNIACLVGDRAIEWLQNDNSFMRLKNTEMSSNIEISDLFFAPIIEAYDRGVENALIGDVFPVVSSKKMWRQQALFFFIQADNLLDEMRESMTYEGSERQEQWSYWRKVVQKEIDALRELKISFPHIPTE